MPVHDDLEISVSSTAGFSSTDSDLAMKAKEAFEELGTLLSEAVAPLRQKLVDTANSADEVEVKLDLALKASGKWIVVSMEAGATVSAKLVWKKK